MLDRTSAKSELRFSSFVSLPMMKLTSFVTAVGTSATGVPAAVSAAVNAATSGAFVVAKSASDLLVPGSDVLITRAAERFRSTSAAAPFSTQGPSGESE